MRVGDNTAWTQPKANNPTVTRLKCSLDLFLRVTAANATEGVCLLVLFGPSLPVAASFLMSSRKADLCRRHTVITAQML